MDAITLHHLTKRFGNRVAVNDVSFTVRSGTITALIGPNGAGKTTLLKMLVGLTPPTSGDAILNGHDITKTPIAAKREFGYISDDPSAYEYLSGREFLTFTGRLRGLSEHEIQNRLVELLPLFPLADIIDEPMSDYSRGNKQKTAFLSSILARPKLLLIDEPIVGMDATSIETLGKFLHAYAKEGNTVLIVTHILEFASQYASRALIMREGSIHDDVRITKTTTLEPYFK